MNKRLIIFASIGAVVLILIGGLLFWAVQKQKQTASVPAAATQVKKVLDKSVNSPVVSVDSTATASSQFVDLPGTEWTTDNFSDTIGDFPRVKPTVYNMVQTVFTNSQTQSLNIIVRSALRKAPQFEFSCHFLGEAVDIAFLTPIIPMGAKQTPANAALIDKLLTIVRAADPNGFVQDEYRDPSPGATGGHVHMHLTPTSCAGRQNETPPSSEYHMPGTNPT